jgi:hypothetical protein
MFWNPCNFLSKTRVDQSAKVAREIRVDFMSLGSSRRFIYIERSDPVDCIGGFRMAFEARCLEPQPTALVVSTYCTHA